MYMILGYVRGHEAGLPTLYTVAATLADAERTAREWSSRPHLAHVDVRSISRLLVRYRAGNPTMSLQVEAEQRVARLATGATPAILELVDAAMMAASYEPVIPSRRRTYLRRLWNAGMKVALELADAGPERQAIARRLLQSEQAPE